MASFQPVHWSFPNKQKTLFIPNMKSQNENYRTFPKNDELNREKKGILVSLRNKEVENVFFKKWGNFF